MSSTHHLHRLAFCASVALTANAHAGSGSWTAIAAGNWNDPLNWQGGTASDIADASGFTATFGSDITAATTVTLDTARTIGNIVFSDNGAAGSPWTVTHATNILTLAGTTPTITATTDATVSSIVTGTAGLKKDGAGILALTTKTNTYTGGTTVAAGTLTGSIGVAFNGTQAGSFSTGDITVNSGATLRASGFFVIGGGQNTTRALNLAGTANLQSAGTGGEYIRTLNMTGGAITFDSGSIYFRAANGGIALTSLASSQSSTISTGIDLTLGSLAVDTATGTVPNGRDLVISGNITQNTGAGSGAKTLTKNGTGTLALGGSCSYTGATTVNGGTLLVDGTLGTASGSTVNVAADATLGGTGTINRAINLAANSTLAPGGTAIGTLTAGGTLSMLGKTTCQINKTGGILTQDLLASTGALTYGGTLEVTATGDTLALGDSFKLFDATSFGGGFTGFTMPTLPSGLSWNLSNLTVDGSVSVVNFVGTPIFTPPAGGYAGTPSVTIASDAGATIYYTVNGSTPTTSSPVYSGPIPVPSNTANYTIKAFAKKTGQANSPVTSSVYSTTNTPTWISTNNGFWSNQPGDETNWQNSVVAGGSGVAADFSTVALTQSTTVTLDGARTIGHLTFGDASPTPASDWLLDSLGGSILTLATNTGTPSVTVNNQTTTISAPVASTQGLTKSGAGTLKLSSVSGYTGETTVNAGTLLLDSSSTPSNTPQLATEKITNASTVRFYRAAAGFSHVNASLSGAGDFYVDGPGGGSIFDNRVAFRGTASDNTGTVRIINNGRLWVDLAGTNAIGDSAIVNVGPTASLHIYRGVTETIGGLEGSGEVWAQDSVATPATLVVGGGDKTASFSGALKENVTKLTITKIGTGTQTFSGSNTHTGATTVEGGTLAGTGAVGSDVTVKTGATLAPGAGVGTMDTKALTFESGSTLKVEVDSTTGTADKVVAHGAVSLTGVTASFAEVGSGTVAAGTRLVILDYTGQTLTGTFASLAEGASVTVGANTVTLAYADNSQVTLTTSGGTGFSSWATANAQGQTMEMDHDHDGVPNGIEYFMGLNGSAFTANPAMNAARLISWPKGARYAGVYGTDYVVQTSIDLSAWTDVPVGNVTIDADSVDYTVPTGGPKKFARLKVTGP